MNETTNHNAENPIISEASRPDGNEFIPALLQPVFKPEPPRDYATAESVFSWLSLAAGYVFCRVFPVSNNSFGGFLFVISLYIATFIILKIKGVKPDALPVAAAVSAIFVSFTLILCSNSFLCLLAYCYSLLTYCYFVYAVTGNTLKRGFTDLILIDYFKALFMLPFCSIDHIFKAMFSGKAAKSGKIIARTLTGICIAIVPTAMVLLLLSYDSAFTGLLSTIFDFDIGDIFSHIFSLLFGIPIGAYIFGLFISSTDNKCSDYLTSKICESVSNKIKIAPVITTFAAVVPILSVYVIFFISQWQYYISGFTGVLPENFSYAEYAREGFFQLCAVSVINLVIIVSVVLFMRRKTEKPPVMLKILSVIFSVFTLILISTAIAKMVMYIDCYGLTHKRVYATWFMVLIALIFILIAIRQFVPKFNAVAASALLCIVLFAALSLSNVDGLIARYNVSRYMNDSLETVDISAMTELGDAAIPELVELAEFIEEKGDYTPHTQELYTQAISVLNERARRFDNEGTRLFSFNIPSVRAKLALEKWKI